MQQDWIKSSPYILFLTAFIFSQTCIAENIIESGGLKYLSHTVIVKFKDDQARSESFKKNVENGLAVVLSKARLQTLKKIFLPNNAIKQSELDKIYLVKYSENVDPISLSAKLRKLKEIEWAEPKFIYEVDYIPNDPSYSTQYALQKIKAADAWNISTGDTSIVIAIIDTGVDWDHPDLASNIWRNWNDIPGNGIDDDANGFVDDIRGWDFGGLSGAADNDPMEDRPDHGTHVAGDASAVTDNLTGISSIGFRTKILPVKTSRDDMRNLSGSPYIVYGFEGIKYAAENGAKVINCSWGGSAYSMLGQEVINYATSIGSLVVAAAGNNNSSSPFYPASYQNVLSVAATDESDMKTSFSNYGSGVDVSAPGINIYSTWQNDTYLSGLGTSFSSPIVAGLAALVKSAFPLLSPSQIAEQIRINCDDINSINPNYEYQLGRGRVNAYKSLSNMNSKSVRAIEIKFLDDLPGGNGNGVLQPGETIKVFCSFVNYLSPTNNLGVYLESSSNYAVVQNAVFIAGAKATLDTFNNNNSFFTIQLSQDVPLHTPLTFNFFFNDAEYQDFQQATVIANPEYSTQAGNNIAMTITSRGNFAFNDFPVNLQGDGFRYLDGPNRLFEGALICGTSPERISDAARGPQLGHGQSKDFAVIEPLIISSPGKFANVEGSCIMNDDSAASKIGISIELNSFSFDDFENENSIILKYKIKNSSASPINNLYAGLFFDWDIEDGTDDFTAYDTSGNFGYVYHVSGNPTVWIASALLSSENFGFYAINNEGGDGGFGIYDGFTDSEKWMSISGGIIKPQAGAGDVSHVVSSGPFYLLPNETIITAFAVAAGFSLSDLRTSIANARTKYSQIPTSVLENTAEQSKEFNLEQNYPNPFNPSTKIKFTIPASSPNPFSKREGTLVSLKVYDVLGNEVATLADEYKPAGRYEVEFNSESSIKHPASGVYFYQLRAGNFIQTRKMILIK